MVGGGVVEAVGGGTGPILASSASMGNEEPLDEQTGIEEQGAKEDQMQKIDAIVGDEVLGYEGTARGEHSGQATPDDQPPGDGLGDRLAENRPDQMT